MSASGWLLAPNSLEQASYGPVIFLLGILASFALAALGNLEHSLKEQDRKDDQFVPAPVMPGVSISLTKRSQALRMYRRGETAEHISAGADPSYAQLPRSSTPSCGLTKSR